MHLTVNEARDFRVRFAKTDKRFVPRLDGKIPKSDVEPTEAVQKSFALV